MLSASCDCCDFRLSPYGVFLIFFDYTDLVDVEHHV